MVAPASEFGSAFFFFFSSATFGKGFRRMGVKSLLNV